jgi:cysteinyl-tRNA synthetase
MTLSLHNADAQSVCEFHPALPGHASLCLTSAVTQGAPDIAHLRPAVCFDILIRWLEASGYRVTCCRNVTAADDGNRSASVADATTAERIPWWVVAQRSRRSFSQACTALGCRTPDVEPLVADQVPEMVASFGPFDISWPQPGVPAALPETVVPLTEALDHVRAQELRYYLAQAHYRSSVEYSDEALEQAAAAYQRIERFIERGRRLVAAPTWLTTPPVADVPISFAAALDDDLCVPAALAALHATVHDGNYAIAWGDVDAVATSLAQVRSMLAVLGLDPADAHWGKADTSDRRQSTEHLHRVIEALVALALRQREEARARGDYASADSIRVTLETTGVEVEDTPTGPRWELKR